MQTPKFRIFAHQKPPYQVAPGVAALHRPPSPIQSPLNRRYNVFHFLLILINRYEYRIPYSAIERYVQNKLREFWHHLVRRCSELYSRTSCVEQRRSRCHPSDSAVLTLAAVYATQWQWMLRKCLTN